MAVGDELEFELLSLERPSGVTVGGDWSVVLPVFRSCCDCGDEFECKSDKDIRCVPCRVWDDLA